MKDLKRALERKRDHLTGDHRRWPAVGGNLAQRRDFAHGKLLGDDLSYFIGPKPDGTDLERVKEFESVVGTDDIIGPCLQRITDAIVGRDPEWSLSADGLTATSEPEEGTSFSPEQQAIIERLQALEAAGGDWHVDVDLQAALAKAHYTAQWAGEAYVRFYLPEELSRLDPDFEAPEGVELSEDDLEEVNPALRQGSLPNVQAGLERLHLEVYDPTQAGEVKSQNGVLKGYYFLYKRDDVNYVEYHTPLHIIHYKRSGNGLEEVTRYDSPFAEANKGRYRRRKFMMIKYEREGGPVLTDDLMQKQSRLNATLTNGNRNDYLAGYRSVITTNADPVTKVNALGEEVEAEWKLAPDIVTELVGLPGELDAEGNPIRYETPGVHVIDPVNPDYNLKWAGGWEERVYRTLNQLHIYYGMQGGLAVEAKHLMREPFDKHAMKDAGPLALLLATVVERVLSFAQWLSQEETLEVSCTPRMYLEVLRGNLEQFKVLVDAFDRGLATVETVVESNPAVTDPVTETKEVKRIQEERRERERQEVEALRLTTSAP